MITLTGTPTLDTERLHLRAPQPQDAAAFIRFYATDRSRFTGGPKTERAAWDFFCTELGHWVMHGFGMFTVTRHGDDTTLGIVGHWFPRTRPEREVGWVLFNPADEGQGIAREAAQACIDHAWNRLCWDTIVSYIDPDNATSIALAKRLGATRDPNAPPLGADKPALVYRHPKP
ncbi:MAG: GNAT family N-acetyltransferase [Pseudomonadota bacterium]